MKFLPLSGLRTGGKRQYDHMSFYGFAGAAGAVSVTASLWNKETTA